MEKRKEKADLEQLLNSLIEKGWKPFGDNAIKFDYDWMKTRYWYWAITYLYRDSYIDDYWDKVEYEEWKHQFNNRELVSKESWLWQFVCENGMINANDTPEENAINYWRYNREDLTEWRYMRNYQYRLIESSLKDESELKDFLLQNIKVW